MLELQISRTSLLPSGMPPSGRRGRWEARSDTSVWWALWQRGRGLGNGQPSRRCRGSNSAWGHCQGSLLFTHCWAIQLPQNTLTLGERLQGLVPRVLPQFLFRRVYGNCNGRHMLYLYCGLFAHHSSNLVALKWLQVTTMEEVTHGCEYFLQKHFRTYRLFLLQKSQKSSHLCCHHHSTDTTYRNS